MTEDKKEKKVNVLSLDKRLRTVEAGVTENITTTQTALSSISTEMKDSITQIRDESAKVAEDNAAMRKRMEDVFAKMTRIETTQRSQQVKLDDLAVEQDRACKEAECLKQESRRTSLFVGMVAGLAAGLALVCLAFYMAVV